jgi:hypothetical protein
MSVDFCSLPDFHSSPPAGSRGKWKSAYVRQKMVTLIYPDPFLSNFEFEVIDKTDKFQKYLA